MWPPRIPREKGRLSVIRTRNLSARHICLFLRSRLIGFSSQDNQLWVDKYAPQSLQDLAVHKRKVDDVRRWLVDAFDEKGPSKHRVSPSICFPVFETSTRRSCDNVQRLLIFTGPAGSGKTTTLRVLAREMDFDIVEFKGNTNTTRFSTFGDEPSACTSGDSFFFWFQTFSRRIGA
jgi:Tfp pilus assembly pilus retraction ATPase PilT